MLSPFRVVCRCLFGLSIVFSTVTLDVRADEYPTTCNYIDELCGWVDETAEQTAAAAIAALVRSFLS